MGASGVRCRERGPCFASNWGMDCGCLDLTTHQDAHKVWGWTFHQGKGIETCPHVTQRNFCITGKEKSVGGMKMLNAEKRTAGSLGLELPELFSAQPWHSCPAKTSAESPQYPCRLPKSSFYNEDCLSLPKPSPSTKPFTVYNACPHLFSIVKLHKCSVR